MIHVIYWYFCLKVFGTLYSYVTINALGYLTAYLSEKNQRRAFLEIKESIIANAYIEEQLLDQVYMAFLMGNYHMPRYIFYKIKSLL